MQENCLHAPVLRILGALRVARASVWVTRIYPWDKIKIQETWELCDGRRRWRRPQARCPVYIPCLPNVHWNIFAQVCCLFLVFFKAVDLLPRNESRLENVLWPWHCIMSITKPSSLRLNLSYLFRRKPNAKNAFKKEITVVAYNRVLSHLCEGRDSM